MTAFYFDVGGVLIPDKLAPDNALNVFRELGERYSFNPAAAYMTYTKLQPSLDLGATSLTELCAALGVEQRSFERDWLTLHPVNDEVIEVIQRLLEHGHGVGLATNFCRRYSTSSLRRQADYRTLWSAVRRTLDWQSPLPNFFVVRARSWALVKSSLLTIVW